MGSGQVGVGVSGGVFLCWLLVKGWAWGGSCVFSSVLPTTPFVKVLACWATGKTLIDRLPKPCLVTQVLFFKQFHDTQHAPAKQTLRSTRPQLFYRQKKEK